MQAIPESGTVLYDCALDIDRIMEFGIGLEAVLDGQDLPPEGVRIDAFVSGQLVGGLLHGHMTAVDYLYIRPDGKISMHVHGDIETHDGARLSLFIEGVLTRRSDGPNLDLRETVGLFTSDARYQWVNSLQIWGDGIADMVNQKVIVQTRVA